MMTGKRSTLAVFGKISRRWEMPTASPSSIRTWPYDIGGGR